jgi:hypothetical protein
MFGYHDKGIARINIEHFTDIFWDHDLSFRADCHGPEHFHFTHGRNIFTFLYDRAFCLSRNSRRIFFHKQK